MKEETELFTPEKVYAIIKDKTPKEFISTLLNEVIKRHSYTAVMKLRYGNIKSFLFVKENNWIEMYENKFSPEKFRDYIWDNMYSILHDVGLIEIKDNYYRLTKEGEKWLSRIK